MNEAAPSIVLKDTDQRISPDYVRISMAAAIELGLKRGSLMRGCSCGCINLLQNYPQGCYANCSYCGLARERPGTPEDNTFIRVDWPLYATGLIAERIAYKEERSEVGRVCISQVQDHRANDDLITIAGRIHDAAPRVPLSALINSTTMTESFLYEIQSRGVDIIGIGLDAACEEVFYQTRGRGAKGPHQWQQHWEIIRAARKIFGPMKVNCHIVVGLGESDRDLVELFYQLKNEQIACYLFSFNPEPGTAMQHVERQPIHRHRRVQLVKHLIEEENLPPEAIVFDRQGFIERIDYENEAIEASINSGLPFMTDGCPDRHGVMACNRPYGSYRPGEKFRDYPFRPEAEDLQTVRRELRLRELVQIERG